MQIKNLLIMNHKFIIIDLYLFGLIIRYSGNPNKTPPPIILPKVTTIICIAIKPKLAPLPKAPIVKVKEPILAILCSNPGKTNAITTIIIIIVLAVSSCIFIPT